MRCGNMVPAQEANRKCRICKIKTVFVIVTEENEHTLPFPTNPPQRINFDDPSKNCQCAPGLCPCGKFVSHLASESWDPENPHLFGGEAMKYHREKKAKEQ